ncbi:hypothetical protein [Olivibacter domesticus]|uniref:Uncharacterized protein n=1 Tax=Olivibacter domesticus TaxID=407022 RepID=A0A1H7IB64_OLID1|nr:hypothetical protein [Olivibacter domesticus]SEK59112.1 hypothetical protein SAMN05661044_00627 [Olivibacter domesticus]
MEEMKSEEAERRLPEIDIHGTAFIVDVAFSELREKGKADNCISFHELDNVPSGGYFLWYDKKRKQAADIYSDDSQVVAVHLDEMVKNDPLGMSSKYGIALADLPERDVDCRFDASILARRENEVPIVKILDNHYLMDIPSGILKPLDKAGPTINMREFSWDGNVDKSFFYYDYEERKRVIIPPDIMEEPKNVVLVVLPNIFFMDREFPQNVLRDQGSATPQTYYPTRVFPLSETIIPALIEENKRMSTARVPKKGFHI